MASESRTQSNAPAITPADSRGKPRHNLRWLGLAIVVATGAATAVAIGWVLSRLF